VETINLLRYLFLEPSQVEATLPSTVSYGVEFFGILERSWL
jgi:hypothetical protein